MICKQMSVIMFQQNFIYQNDLQLVHVCSTALLAKHPFFLLTYLTVLLLLLTAFLKVKFILLPC